MEPSTLLAPVAFRSGLELPNRLALAPMTNLQSHADGTLSDDELHWLTVRADGGFGLIETCAAHVARDGQTWEGELGVFDDAQIHGLAKLAHTLRTRGARSIVQLFHGGVRAQSKLTGERPWSACEFEDDAPNFEKPRAATERDIAQVIAQFRAGAVRAREAGFDGVELHGAHGYLLSQFLSTTMNRRTDAWGGSLEGRARLLRETLRAVRAAVPNAFTVGVRLSPEDYGFARGLDLDESLQVAKWVCEDGADFVSISLWNAFQNTKKRPDEHAIPLFRAVCPSDVRLVVAGSVWTRAEGEALVARGADVIALGRAAIANPDWPKRMVDAEWQPRRPPLTVPELRERGLSEGFANYLRRWPGFVV